MSTGKEILIKISTFIRATGDLITSDAVKGLVKIAKELGLEQEIHGSIEKLESFAKNAVDTLSLWQEKMSGIEGFKAAIALTLPLIEGISSMIKNTGIALEKAGLSQNIFINSEISGSVNMLGNGIENAILLFNSIPASNEIGIVIKAINDVNIKLNNFKNDFKES